MPITEEQKRYREEARKRNLALIRELRAEGLTTIQIANRIHAPPSAIVRIEKEEELKAKQEPISR